MKRRITLSIVLVLILVLVTLVSNDSQAQQNRRAVFDTGLITPGPNQILRITVSTQQRPPLDLNDLYVFKRMNYMSESSNGGIWKYRLENEQQTPPTQLGSNEALSFDIAPTSNQPAVRGMVITNNRNAKVSAMIIDTVTGQIDSILIALIVP